MKVEECIVTVERRSMGGCLDLAFVFAGVFRTFVSIVADLCGAVVRSGLAACFRHSGDAVMVDRHLFVF